MIATYYAIKEYNSLTCKTGDIVDEGVLGPDDDIIHPGQTSGIPELPFECEIHHFKAEGYIIETCQFTITRDIVKQYRTTGDKID